MSWLKSVTSFVQRKPLLFNGTIGGIVLGTSDGIAQQIELCQQNHFEVSLSIDELDAYRLISATLLGVLFGGGIYPYAYAKLDKIWFKKDLLSIFTKSMVEIALVGVCVNTLSMTGRGLLSGRTPKEVVHHVMNELPRITINDFKVWLPYNMIAFSIIPPLIRPSTTAFMEAMWQTYISLRSNDYNNSDKVTFALGRRNDTLKS